MNVAVPLLQHSQWFGHLALSQTVWSLSSSSKARVCVKLALVGNFVRSQSGSRGRHLSSTMFKPSIWLLPFLPKLSQFIRPEIGQHLAIYFYYRRQALARKPDHLIKRGLVSHHVNSVILDPMLIEPVGCLVAPAAIGFNE